MVPIGEAGAAAPTSPWQLQLGSDPLSPETFPNVGKVTLV
jgi:hypothetical protein